MKKIFLLSMLLPMLFFSCLKEEIGVGVTNLQGTQKVIAENGLDLTPFLHMGDDVLGILRALNFTPATLSALSIETTPLSVEIPGLGHTRTFYVKGGKSTDNMEIIARELYDGELAGSRVTWSSGGRGETEITFPPHTDISSKSKVYLLEYSVNGGEPQVFKVLIQHPVAAHFQTDLASYNYTVARGGVLLKIYKNGTYPEKTGDSIEFRLALNQNPDNYLSSVFLTDPTKTELAIEVPINSGEARLLTIYYRSANSDWVKLDYCIQLGKESGDILTDWVASKTTADPLNAYGGTVFIALKGNFHRLNVRLIAANSYGETVVTETKTVLAGEFPGEITHFDFSPFDGAVSFKFPAFENNGWPNNLDLRYKPNSNNFFVWHAQVDTGDGWKYLTSNSHGSNQIGQPFFQIKISEEVNIVPANYTAWPVKVEGYWVNRTSNNLVQLCVVSDRNNPSGTMVSIHRLDPRSLSSPVTEVTLSVPINNTGKSRMFYVMFSLDEGRTWNKWYYDGWDYDGAILQNP